MKKRAPTAGKMPKLMMPDEEGDDAGEDAEVPAVARLEELASVRRASGGSGR